jgi:PAS domain S-box/diguanylate cyclase (GGDEF) domain
MANDEMKRHQDWYAALRQRAEEVLTTRGAAELQVPSTDLCRLIHDLHVSQLELEMQNVELRQAYADLQAIRDKYLDLYDFAPVAYLTLDENGFVREINLAGSTLLGIAKADIIGKLLVMWVAAADRDAFRMLRREVMRCTQARTAEMRMMRDDGQLIYVCIEALALRCEINRPTGARIIIHDLTHRKEAEDALFQQKERLQITLQSIGDAVITTDLEGQVDFLNPTAEKLTGWSLEMALGKPLETIFHVVDERTKKPVANPVRKCLRHGEVLGLGTNSLLVSRIGREFSIQDSAAPIRDRQRNIVGAVLVFQDVTEARKLAQQVAHQASHDPLTGLVNRREFEKRLDRAFNSAKLQAAEHALCFVDLDGFKIVNDTAGHTAGDELLKQIASLLSRFGRSRDSLARLGGDEFCLLMENCSIDRALIVAERMVDAVRSYGFSWDGRIFNVGASVGLIPINQKSTSVQKILTDADLACYTAKDLGRNRVHTNYERGRGEGSRSVPLVHIGAIQKALDENLFCLFCQPIVSLVDRQPMFTMYEVLLRMLDDRGALIRPDAFIPIAERYGIMPSIDRWVIRETLQKAAGLAGINAKCTLTINLSGHTINDVSLFDYFANQLTESGFCAEQLCVEITETATIHNFKDAAKLIAELRGRGCRFALDDFGKGVSSMAYLKNMSVDYLKIDGSFVSSMADNRIDRAMIAAMNEMAHALNIKTIAECAESAPVVDQLARLGVDYVQGFAVGRPRPLETLLSGVSVAPQSTAGGAAAQPTLSSVECRG